MSVGSIGPGADECTGLGSFSVVEKLLIRGRRPFTFHLPPITARGDDDRTAFTISSFGHSMRCLAGGCSHSLPGLPALTPRRSAIIGPSIPSSMHPCTSHVQTGTGLWRARHSMSSSALPGFCVRLALQLADLPESVNHRQHSWATARHMSIVSQLIQAGLPIDVEWRQTWKARRPARAHGA